PGHPGRRRADAQLRRERLRARLWLRSCRLCRRRLRRPRPNGQGGQRPLRFSSERGPGEASGAADQQAAQAREAAAPRALRPVDLEEIRLRRAELRNGALVPDPPFWGARLIERVPVKALVPYLNERMLFQFQWGFR